MAEGIGRVVVVGAGLGGLAAGIKLKQAGAAGLTILEKASAVGGTWRQNTYPGCACDVPVALYQYSFFPGFHWSHTFPRQPEMQAYAEMMADQGGLRPHLTLDNGAKAAAWDEGAKLWRVTDEAGTVHEAEALVVALGQLDRPKMPEIAGLASFSGQSFHAAAWDDSVDLKGKRVGVIGSAASAVQLIPEVAKLASHLTVFQRTPNWVGPRRDQAISMEEKMLMMTNPAMAVSLGQRQRDLIFDNADTFFWQAFSWSEAGRAAFTKIAMAHLESQVRDPVLKAKLTPDYPVGCTRFLFADDYYPALCRENVTLETGAIERVTGAGVQIAGGASHELDVLIYATGFETTGWKWSMDVTGTGGTRLADAWADGPEAYKGVTVSGFPNMFVLYGPNTNLGHNAITWMMERQIEYLIAALSGLSERGAKALDVRADAQRAFNEALQASLAGTAWADPKCSSWYKTSAGRITQNWGGNCASYGEVLKDIVWDDYQLLR
jgi:cation diffusion facilitator CzcD-associated flavoprotein CzcO